MGKGVSSVKYLQQGPGGGGGGGGGGCELLQWNILHFRSG